MENDNDHNTLEAAKRYAELGFYPVPIPAGTKGPRTKGWQELKIGPEQVPEYWLNDEGVGLLLGANGLACLDADTPEAVRILPVALKSAHVGADTLVGGRYGNCRTHYFYRPNGDVKHLTLRGPDDAVIIELLAGNHQTVVAPSKHPNGDTYNWETPGGNFEPELIKEADQVRLEQAVRLTALISRHMPNSGRNQYVMALAGLLRRNGRVPREAVLWAFQMVWRDVRAEEAVLEEIERALNHTEDELRAGNPVLGGPTVDKVVPGLAKSLLAAWGCTDDYSGDERTGRDAPTQTDVLLEIASDAELWHSPEGVPHATVAVGEHVENVRIDDGGLSPAGSSARSTAGSARPPAPTPSPTLGAPWRRWPRTAAGSTPCGCGRPEAPTGRST